MRKVLQCLLVMSLLITTGCASSMMKKTESNMLPPADEEKATVVFMRPSSFGGAIQSTVYEVKADQPEFIGIVSTDYKIAYQAEPGKTLFMVVGESADFMEAELAPNHIYYVTVVPRVGFWKARFSLAATPESEFDDADFKENVAECDFVQNTPESLQWAEAHEAEIQALYERYYEKWQGIDEDRKAKLMIDDGREM